MKNIDYRKYSDVVLFDVTQEAANRLTGRLIRCQNLEDRLGRNAAAKSFRDEGTELWRDRYTVDPFDREGQIRLMRTWLARRAELSSVVQKLEAETLEETSSLDEAALEEIWLREIRPRLELTSQAPEGTPVTVLLGGQPGAGKSRSGLLAQKMHAGAHLVAVIGDDVRPAHPDYDQAVTEDPLNMPHITAEASGRWIARSVDHVREQGRSLLLEGTWRSPETVLGGAKSSKRVGHLVHAVLVGVPAEMSRLGSLERYYRDRDAGFDARWTPPSAHNAAVSGLPATIATLTESDDVDRFSIVARDGQILYDDENNSRGSAAAMAAFETVQNRPLSAEELAVWNETAQELHELHLKHTPDDPDAIEAWRRILTVDRETLESRSEQNRSSAD